VNSQLASSALNPSRRDAVLALLGLCWRRRRSTWRRPGEDSGRQAELQALAVRLTHHAHPPLFSRGGNWGSNATSLPFLALALWTSTYRSLSPRWYRIASGLAAGASGFKPPPISRGAIHRYVVKPVATGATWGACGPACCRAAHLAAVQLNFLVTISSHRRSAPGDLRCQLRLAHRHDAAGLFGMAISTAV
jgi:hypothetical protein